MLLTAAVDFFFLNCGVFSFCLCGRLRNLVYSRFSAIPTIATLPPVPRMFACEGETT